MDDNAAAIGSLSHINIAGGCPGANETVDAVLIACRQEVSIACRQAGRGGGN